MMAVLDNQLMDLVEQQGTAVISQLWRASGSLDTTNLDPKIRALVALPLRSDTSFHGVLWVAYNQERMFEESDLTFLSTLAGQAAVATSNARLFTEADQGKRKLEAVLSSTADGMIVVDKDSNIILVNPAAEKYLEIRAEQAASKKASQVIDNPELANLMTNLQEPISSLEIPYRNGKTLLANTSPIMGHDGGISGRVAVLRDITALKELDNIKTVFLRMVSHDLRSPLTYMRGYTQLIHLSGVLNERQVEAVERINNGIDHITQMTERLTYLSRLQFGEDVELEMALIDVKDMLEQETQRHQELAKQKEITIKVVVEENLPLLLADQLLFSHAISNLIQNALKYTQENGKILVKAAVDGSEPRQISVAVIDNGPGIREEDQAHLFEAFYRVPQRPGDPTRPKGSGLGLALVRSIANAHNGAASVESEFGKGSMFKITFPVRNSSEL